MPRKAKGQRTDLNQAIKAGPSQQYGQREQQLAAQRVIPLPANPGPPTPSAAPASSPIQASLPTGPLPGGLGALDRPTERLGEPVTTGLATGPGMGSEALSRQFGPNFDNEDLLALRDYLPALEVLASLPSASMQTRNFVRRIRGAMPVEDQRG